MAANIKILHLEDVPSDAALVAYTLKKAGLDFEILVVNNRLDYLENLESFQPDIVLSDHSLPSFNSNEALEILKASALKIPFILITSTMSDAFAAGILREGASDYILKDRLERLPLAISNILEKFRFEKERQEFLEIALASERKFRKLIENNADAIVILDPQGTPLFASPSIERVLGYTKADGTAINMFEICHPDDRERIHEKMAAAMENPGLPVQRHPMRIRHKDGSWRYMEGTFNSLLHDPAVHGIIANFRDVTKRIRSEEAVRENEEKYRLLFEYNPLPCLIYDQENYSILDVNKAAVKHYGYNRREFLEMKVTDLRPDSEKIHALEYLKTTGPGSANKMAGTLARHRKKDGSLIQVEIKAYRLKFGNREGILKVCNDITEKEANFRALQEKSEKLERLERIAKLGYWELDLKQDRISWTDEVYRIWEKDKTSFLPGPENFKSTIHPEDIQKFEEEYRAAVSGLRELDLEHRIVLPEGKIKWVREKAKLRRNATGEAVVLEGTVQDITDFKNAVEKLTWSESLHRGLINSQTNYVVRVDLEGKYTYCNEKFSEDFGWIYPGGNAIGQDTMVSINDYHYNRVLEVSQKCMARPHHVFQTEIDKPGRNGTKTTLWDFICLTDSNDQPKEIQCIGIDITDRKVAEEANTFQANLLSRIGQAVVATDPKGIISYWNAAATKIYGWTEEEVMGKNIMEITPSIGSERRGLEIMEAVSRGQNWTGEFMVKRKDGSEFPAMVTDSPIYDDKQNLKGIVGISSDITERKNTDRNLRELNKNLKNYTEELVVANKGLEQFSYIISHNLRAPLANILGLADLIDGNEDEPELKEEFWGELMSNVKRLDQVISDLNDILKVKAEVNTKKETVNLEQLVGNIGSSIKDLITREQVEIKTDFDELPEINTIPGYLHSIFYNLIVNSIKYRRPGVRPVIRIKSCRENNDPVLYFEDNGLGIDLARRGNQIFGLYKRFHPQIEGKGMGLFMVKTQAEMLGAEISVTSEVNKGSTFSVKFNQSKVKTTSYEESPAVPSGG